MVKKKSFRSYSILGILTTLLLILSVESTLSQDILTMQLQQGFGKNKVRYKDFKWEILESEHLELHFEPEFYDLAVRAIHYLEEGYDHISGILHHELSHKPPIVIYQSQYEFQQTNIIREFLPPGVAGFAEPLRYRMVIPFDGDLDEFRNVLIHELTHIFQYDIVYKGPVKRLSSSLSSPPTWIMEGLAEYTTPGRNTIDEMVLRDAVLTDRLIPIETMDAAWGSGNVFLAYKQSHSIMEYIAEQYGPEKISRILRLWDSQKDTDKLMERLINLDMKTLDEQWSAQMRKQYWPLLQARDYASEIGKKISSEDREYQSFSMPSWSLSGDMITVLSSDGIEQHIDIIRIKDGSLVERITSDMLSKKFDHLTGRGGTIAWAPDGRSIAFVAKQGDGDAILIWDLYKKELRRTMEVSDVETIESLAWAPDSKKLALVGTGDGQSDLYLSDTENGSVIQLTGSPQREDHPSFSPDGSKIVFVSKFKSQFDIKVIEIDTKEATTIFNSSTDELWPQWLPEGNKLLFVSTREKINDLFVYHLDEEKEYRLTQTLSGIMNPSLSPDGRKIIFNSYFQGQNELFIMNMPDMRELRRIDADLTARVNPSSRKPYTAPRIIGKRNIVRESSSPLLTDEPLQKQSKLGIVPDELAAEAILLASSSQKQAESKIKLDASEKKEDAKFSLIKTEEVEPIKRKAYTPMLEFDGVSVQMGYFDGFFSSVAQLSMSDLLGNHNLSLMTDYVASQEVSNDFNFAVSYDYYGKRPTYHASIFNWNQYFNNDRSFLYGGRFVSGINRVQQRGLLTNTSYPIDLYRRLDFSYTYVGEQEDLIWPLQELGPTISTHLFKSAYVHDSITYGLLGPTVGRRYFLSAGRTLDTGGSSRSFSHIEVDYRNYLRLGQWSVLGIRAYGVGSLGKDALNYNLGGPTWFLPFYTGLNLNTGPLRGFDFSEFNGSRVGLANIELRVPFVRGILFGWPTTFVIPAIDGSIFFDIGTAWEEGDRIDPWPLFNPDINQDQKNMKDEDLGALEKRPRKPLYASIGFGLLTYFILPMNFEFARKTDLQGHYSDYHFHFSFGKSF